MPPAGTSSASDREHVTQARRDLTHAEHSACVAMVGRPRYRPPAAWPRPSSSCRPTTSARTCPASPSGSSRPSPASSSCSSTTTRPTAPASCSTTSRRRSRGSTSCTGPASSASVPRTSRASRGDSTAASTPLRDGCRRQPRSEVPAEMLALAEDGADVVVGSRNVPGGGTVNWGIGRKLISRGGSLYARTILGIDVRDVTAGFSAGGGARCCDRPRFDTLERLHASRSRRSTAPLSGAEARRDPDHLRRPTCRSVEDVAGDRPQKRSPRCGRCGSDGKQDTVSL